MEPLLAMGFQPQPSDCLQGALTDELRKLLWGPGEGAVPWFKVELSRDGQPIYYVEEHEDTAGWNGSAQTLQELYDAGVDPAVVIDYDELRRESEARRPVMRGLELLAAAAARVINPSGTGYGYGVVVNSDEGDREYAVLQVGTREQVWLEYDPYAIRRVEDLEGAAALMAQLDPPLEAGDGLRLDLRSGVLVQARTARGLGPWHRAFTHTLPRLALSLSLRPEAAALLDPSGGSLIDHALTRQRNQVWLALTRPLEKRVTGSRPATDFQFFIMTARHMEIRLEGQVIASLTVEPEALEMLLEHPNPGDLLADAPAPAHLLVEKVGDQVRWRQLGAAPSIQWPGTGRRTWAGMVA